MKAFTKEEIDLEILKIEQLKDFHHKQLAILTKKLLICQEISKKQHLFLDNNLN